MTKTLRQRIIERDGLFCQYCGVEVHTDKKANMKNSLVIEHINGREEYLDNLCVSCRRCNSEKNSRTAIQWLRLMRQKIAEAEALKNKCGNIVDLLERLRP